jgi:2-polyprenyl-3-methyl-5-hydroxy-6-metoxy-1,4-benzoquinol methylase
MGNNPEYGTKTLEVISAANNFNYWMYKTIAEHCSGKILEIGSGIGNISKYFLEAGAEISLSDFDKSYMPVLTDQFASKENLKGIYHFDLATENIEKNHPELLGKFDTVFALNVLEHIREHNLAIQNAHKLLRKNGKIVILVPAFQGLFNQFDVQLDHQRRYNAKTLKQLISANGFQVKYSRYFNFVGMLGWFFSGNILRKKMIPEGQMKIYDVLVPLWKIFDVFANKFVGISVIQVGEKDQ